MKALEDGGIQTKEPPHFREEEFYFNSRKRPTLPWEVSEEEALDTSLDRDPEKFFKLPADKKYQ